jgi:hypothetical protein
MGIAGFVREFDGLDGLQNASDGDVTVELAFHERVGSR